MGKRQKKREEKESWRERLCRSLDVPPDVFSGEGLVEIRGRSALCVSGCGKILVYTPEEIRIALRRGALKIEGKRLCCTSYHVGAIGVDGHICRVSFEEE